MNLALLFILVGCATQSFENAYRRALVYGDTPRKGIILFLHGCSGHSDGRLFAWEQSWVDYLTSEGFLFVAPDSFADPRPPQSCKSPYQRKAEIYDIRVRQAQRALQQLRLKYPGTKIFVWGHSEGAGVVNRLDEKVDGVITTGYECGIGGTRRTQVRDDVPFLAIIGTSDSYVQEALLYAAADSVRELCERVFRSPKWEFVILEGMGHSAPIYYPQVKERVDKFLGLGSR